MQLNGFANPQIVNFFFEGYFLNRNHALHHYAGADTWIALADGSTQYIARRLGSQTAFFVDGCNAFV